MVGGVWGALSMGVLVALVTWGWFKANSKECAQQPAQGSSNLHRHKDIADEKDGDLTKANELRASVPDSPIKAVSSCVDDTLDITEITGNCSDNPVPVISATEGLCSSEQVCDPLSEDDPKQPQPFKDFMTNSPSIGKDPNHCIGPTEQTSEEENNENANQTKHCQKLHEFSLSNDEDLDHKWQIESGCLSNETPHVDNSNDDNSDLHKESATLSTEMTRNDEEWEILEQPNTWEMETKVSCEADQAAKKIAAVSPLPLKTIEVKFEVHYVTQLESQILAVTGNHEHLGQWETFVPLKPGKDGLWSGSILLPVNSKIEWKFVVVEDGKVRRWEECLNRCLETSHEDIPVHHHWGCQ